VQPIPWVGRSKSELFPRVWLFLAGLAGLNGESAVSWIFKNARAHFDEYGDQWDDLNRSVTNHILLDSKFVSPAVRHFSTPDDLLCIDNDPAAPAMVLLERTRPLFWQTFQPPQAPLGLAVFKRKESIAEQIQSLIRSLPGNALNLSVLQQDPNYSSFASVAPSSKVQIIDYIDTARLNLVGTFDDYWAGRNKEIVRNIGKRYRALEREGLECRLIVQRDADSVADCIRSYGEIESRGWKAEFGTAIAPDNLQGIFYRQVMEEFCRQGEAVIYQLKFGDQTVACNLCLLRGPMMVALKITYDEEFKRFLPGFLSQYEIIRSLYGERKTEVVEYYGRVRDYHRKWTDDIRTMYHINFYRFALLGVACKLRSYWKHRTAVKIAQPAP
jgi:hypothetical protein